VFLVLGVLLARPATFGRAMPFLFGICGTLAMIDTHNADMVTFMNVTLAQLIGVGTAAAVTGLLRRVGADWTARRLLKAGWQELARLGGGEKITLAQFSARMVDRIALLTPRLAQAGKERNEAAGAFHDLRIGLNMTVLQNRRRELGRGAAALAPVMSQLARRYALLPDIDADAERRLQDALDNALRAISAGPPDDAQEAALAALTSVRRDLFPAAQPYLPHTAMALESVLP
jgi:uncharacterized membrane protein YccC